MSVSIDYLANAVDDEFGWSVKKKSLGRAPKPVAIAEARLRSLR